MRPIPPKLREQMADNKFYKQCCLQDSNCLGKIEWHHNLIFGGKQVNEEFCILPICNWHHDREKHQIYKEKLNWIMWGRATNEQIQSYSKAINYQQVKDRLVKLYGNYKT